MGDSLGILCCTRHCRRLEGERSSQGEVHRVQDSYCSQAGLRIPREVLLLVAGPGDRMEDIPGRELHSCLDGEGEEEEARREVQMEEVHQVHQEEELPEPQEEGGSCCSYCVLDEEGEEGSR